MWPASREHRHPKKARIGNLYRPGTLYTQETVATLAHDFPSLVEGVVMPHGSYDVQQHHGYITLGTSHDMSEYACACLRQWWQIYGPQQYPTAAALLLRCDGGGSTSARTYLFKADLAQLVQEFGLESLVAHSPPTPPSTTRLRIGCFHTSRAPVKALSSPVASWCKS